MIMKSGASRDGAWTSKVVRTTMIFVPLKNEVSHNPKEYTSPEDCELGADALLQAVVEVRRGSQNWHHIVEAGILKEFMHAKVEMCYYYIMGWKLHFHFYLKPTWQRNGRFLYLAENAWLACPALYCSADPGAGKCLRVKVGPLRTRFIPTLCYCTLTSDQQRCCSSTRVIGPSNVR